MHLMMHGMILDPVKWTYSLAYRVVDPKTEETVGYVEHIPSREAWGPTCGDGYPLDPAGERIDTRWPSEKARATNDRMQYASVGSCVRWLKRWGRARHLDIDMVEA